MGRLTFKKFFKHYRYGMETTTVCVSGYTQIVEPEETATGETSHYYLVGEAVDKLAEYESLEEQGLLIRLPCKVGDKVYVTERRVIKCKIKSIEFFECGISIKLMYAGENELLEHWKTSVTIDEFGEKVFLTEEEAEQALERRKNGKID